MSKPFIVVMDGPAASGKSSLCKSLAKRLGWETLNTGLIYRTAAWILEKGFTRDQLLAEIDKCDFTQSMVSYKGQNLTKEITSDQFGQLASTLSLDADIRTALLPIQRKIAHNAKQGILADGRDLGTVVFPDADLKFYITASAEARGKRRYFQLTERDYNSRHLNPEPPTLQDIIKSIESRDLQDSTRSVAPLRQAEDAITIDNTEKNFIQTLNFIEDTIRKQLIEFD